MARRRSYANRSRKGAASSKLPLIIAGIAGGGLLIWFMVKNRSASTYLPPAPAGPAPGGLWQGVAAQAVQAVQSGKAQSEVQKVVSAINPKNWF